MSKQQSKKSNPFHSIAEQMRKESRERWSKYKESGSVEESDLFHLWNPSNKDSFVNILAKALYLKNKL